MKSHVILVPVMLGMLAMGPSIAAEKENPRPDVSSYPFWSAPKRGAVSQFVPGLTAVLGLTDAQKQQIGAAYDAMLNDEGVKTARSFTKNDPSVTDAQREAARTAVEAATAQMREKVNAVLNTEQKALIGNIDGAYATAMQENSAAFQDRLAVVKNDAEARKRVMEEQREEAVKLFRQKLDEMLTAEQKSAMAAAAAQEEKRNTKVADKKPTLK
jgi:hypothetical protein